MDSLYINNGTYYSLPVVETTSKAGQKLYWQIYFGLVQSNVPKDFAEGREPSDLAILSAPILAIYDNNSRMDQKLKGYKITATWRDGGKPILKIATFITSGKNEAKDNRTNVWTQTKKDALSDYNKKNKPNTHHDKLMPMLANGDATTDDNLNSEILKIWTKHSGNVRTQPKLDGHRMMVRLTKNPSERITAYGRSGDDIVISNNLRSELEIMYKTVFDFLGQPDNIIYLDGEYYLHGLSLQDIGGAVRSREQTEEKAKLEYHIFDCVFTTPDGVIVPDDSRERLWKVKCLNDRYGKLTFVKFVESFKPELPSDITDEYNKRKSQGYEGLIIRVSSRPYESKRSTGMVKLKGAFREEFRITNFGEGTGKHAGLIKFQCSLTEESIEKARLYMNSKGKPVTGINIECPRDITFTVTPAATDEERKKMLENGSLYIGKLYTVEFQDWSNDLKPLRPKGIAIYHP